MSTESDTRDRVIRVETEVQQIKEQVKNINDKVDEIHAIFLQAKGAKYTIWIAAGVIGTLMGLIPSLYSYFFK